MKTYDSAAIAAMVGEAEARYPHEGCGLLFASAQGSLRVQPMANVLDRYHARLPDRFPRTSAQGYLIDPIAQMQALEEAAQQGESLHAIFHSHVEVGAYFSDEDRGLAFDPEGDPLFPGVEYVVLSVRSGRCDGLKAYELGTDGAVREQTLALFA
jgi:[CysO sulfur-carrier protein]-S-L-cysteine hydrolase